MSKLDILLSSSHTRVWGVNQLMNSEAVLEVNM